MLIIWVWRQRVPLGDFGIIRGEGLGCYQGAQRASLGHAGSARFPGPSFEPFVGLPRLPGVCFFAICGPQAIRPFSGFCLWRHWRAAEAVPVR